MYRLCRIIFFCFLTRAIYCNNKPTMQEINEIQTHATGVLVQYCDNIREKKMYEINNCQEILSEGLSLRLSAAQIQEIVDINAFKEQKIFNHIGLQVIENENRKIIKAYLKVHQPILQEQLEISSNQDQLNIYLFEEIIDFYDLDVSDSNRYKNYQSYFFSKNK